MTIKRRLLALRHVLKLLPGLLNHLDVLEGFLPKLVALEPILDKIGSLDQHVAGLTILEATVPRLQALDAALVRIHRLGQREPEPVQAIVSTNGKTDHQFARLKTISKFAALAGKAEEIEKEWQKIQQDEHDAFFAFQVMRGRHEVEYAYKKGISEGIKWCVERFS